MCGISCVIHLPSSSSRSSPSSKHATPASKNQLETRLRKSLNSIRHRGPDSEGVWISHDGRVGRSNSNSSPEPPPSAACCSFVARVESVDDVTCCSLLRVNQPWATSASKSTTSPPPAGSLYTIISATTVTISLRVAARPTMFPIPVYLTKRTTHPAPQK